MSSEATAYAQFRSKLAQPCDRFDRIENPLVPGMPDVNICINGIETWIEIKHPKEPVRANTPLFGSNHRLSQEQKNWFLRQRNCRGRAFILINTTQRWLLIEGRHAENLNELEFATILDLAIWHAIKPTNEQQWRELRMILGTR